jgi:predicted nucleic acid-binding protein
MKTNRFVFDTNVIVAKFFADAEIIEIKETISACRDRKDDKFLEVAFNGKADYLITGDRDLLVLLPHKPAIAPSPHLSLFVNIFEPIV